MSVQHVGVFLIGVIIGFLGGLFGKGGSAIATPMLSLIGIPGFVAVAGPLPATVPGMMIASAEYWKSRLLDWQIIGWSIAIGVPATIVGSLLTVFTGAVPLLVVTAVIVLGFGLTFLLSPRERQSADLTEEQGPSPRPSHWRVRLVLVALGIGLVSGLLANSGGFLLAPSYARILRLPIKKAFACSLAAAIFLALPGTIVHAYLGHIDWAVAGILALGSVPFSYLGARVAIRSNAAGLERWYGLALTGLGILFLANI